MAGDKTYITDGQGKLHRATRVHAVTPTDIVWSSNPNDYTVQVKIDGKWHRAVLTMDAGSSTFFDNINIDKALVTGTDGKQHTALIVKPESTVTLSDIKTDTHGTIAGTTTGETAVSTYSENWSDVKWQDNVNVYKVLVTGSDGKVHTALLTTSAGGGVQVIVLGSSPLLLPDAIADSLSYVKAFGGTEQVPETYLDSVTLDGKCEQGGTPTPTVPVDIVSNNGVLKYGVLSSNLLNDTNIATSYDATDNYIYKGYFQPTDSSAYVSATSYRVAHIVLPAGTYTFATDTANCYLLRYSVNGVITNVSASDREKQYFTFTLTEESEFQIVWRNTSTTEISGEHSWVSIGSTATTYEPYRAGIYADGTVETVTDSNQLTATAQMLLSVGDYKDTQEIISGVVTRNVVVKVLDGTEDGYARRSDYAINYTGLSERAHGLSIYGVCSHFVCSASNASTAPVGSLFFNSSNYYLHFFTEYGGDVDSFKSWLAAQYAAGTPVIIVYALETPTTESVPGQSLSKSPVTQTAGAIPGLTITTTESVHTTPAPQQPLDINCNNGAIKFSPNEANYTADNVTLGYWIRNNNGELESAANNFYTAMMPIKPNTSYVCFGYTKDTNVISGYNRIAWYDADGVWIRNSTYTANTPGIDTSPANAAFARFHCNPNGTEVTQELVDSYNWVFQQGTAEVPYTPYSPTGIYTDGTVETVEVVKNYFTREGETTGQIISADGIVSDNSNYCISAIVTLPAGNYMCSWNQGAGNSRPFSVYKCNSNGDIITTDDGGRLFYLSSGIDTGSFTVETETTVRMSYRDTISANSVVLLEISSATTEMLLKVGDYQDEQEILSGAVTRNVGVRVFDGSETFAIVNDTFRAVLDGLPKANKVLCNYFDGNVDPSVSTSRQPDLTIKGNGSYNNTAYFKYAAKTTVEAFQQWLADQYAAGTPVIVIYPLATPTTESVTGQILQVTDGDNGLEITQASLSGLQLEAEYEKEGA